MTNPTLAELAEHLRRTLGANWESVYWVHPLWNGDEGQFSDRDLRQVQRERREQKGRD